MLEWKSSSWKKTQSNAFKNYTMIDEILKPEIIDTHPQKVPCFSHLVFLNPLLFISVMFYKLGNH